MILQASLEYSYRRVFSRKSLKVMTEKISGFAQFRDKLSGLIGGDKRDRTADLLHAMQALSQLSYTPEPDNLVGQPCCLNGGDNMKQR